MSPFTILKYCSECQRVRECDFIKNADVVGYRITAIRCRTCHLVIQHAERLGNKETTIKEAGRFESDHPRALQFEEFEKKVSE
jgi:hypothetical protein